MKKNNPPQSKRVPRVLDGSARVSSLPRAGLEQMLTQYSELYDLAPLGYFRLDRDSTILQVNPAGASLLRLDGSQSSKPRFDAFVSPEFRPVFTAFLASVFSTPGSREACEISLHQTAEAAPLWVQIEAATRDGNECSAAVLDITRNKQVHETLKESQKRFGDVFDYSPLGLSMTGMDGSMKVNQAFCEIVGYSEMELAAKSWQDITHPDDLSRSQAITQGLLEGSIPSARFEKRYIHKSGRLVWVAATTSLHRDERGKPRYFLTTIQDITEHKRAEQQVHSLARFPDENPSPVMRLNDRGILLYANQASRLVLDEWGTAIGGGVPTFLRKKIREALRGKSPLEMDVQIGERWLFFVAAPVVESGYVNLYGIDITARRRAEEALRIEHERFQRFVDSNIVGILIASISGDVIQANDYYLNLVGFGREELEQGRVDWRAVTPPEWLPADEQAIQELREHGTCTPYEKEYLRRDGTRVPVFLADALLPGPGEQIAAFVIDISERKRTERNLQESELRFRSAAESLTDVIYEWDLKDRVDWYGEIDGMLGYPNGKFPRTLSGWTKRLDPQDRPRVMAAVDSQLKGMVPYNIEYRIKPKTGEWRWWSARGTAVRDESGEPYRWIGSITDITQRKQADQKFSEMVAELERSNKELEQFAYVASHDLQEPLRMVSSYTQLLAQRYEGQLDEKAQKYIEYAVDGAVRMQRLINDLLAYSRITTRGEPAEPVDAHALLGDVLRNLSVVIDESHALVTTAELPTVRADPTQLRQLFQNLISNAIKFHGSDPPHVHLSARDLGSEWRFGVKDNGIGIQAKYAERIFVIFQRLHTRQEYPGTGIGLAICKRIVERHGGRIWFESEPGQGATFYFTLPK